mgnify:CR=1 FL=1
MIRDIIINFSKKLSNFCYFFFSIIFSRYYQVEDKDGERSKKGSGLGLYIAKKIINGHGGHIWVESEGMPGQGSTFRFTLPLPDTPVEIEE